MIIQNRAKAFFRTISPVALFVVALLLFVLAVSKVSIKSENEGIRLMEESIRRAAVQCYALEGSYPADFDYLKERYALRPDEKRYVIYYTYTASNLMPDIDVLPVGAEMIEEPSAATD